MARRVEFLYDVTSPYSFVAGIILHRYAQRYPEALHVSWSPFFLGGVMHLSGNQPPATVTSRIPYLLADLKRNSEWVGVDLSMPSNFPAKTLQAQRLLMACSEEKPSLVPNLSFALWRALFQRDEDLSSLLVLQNCCSAINLTKQETEHLLSQTKTPEIKAKLTENTEKAVKRGAFGAPTFFILKDGGEEEMIFGSDRFHFLFPALGIEWKGPHPSPSKL